MAKGYWMVHVEVEDVEAFKAYVAAVVDVFKKYDARFWHGQGSLKLWKARRVHVIQFLSFLAIKQLLIAGIAPNIKRSKPYVKMLASLISPLLKVYNLVHKRAASA